MDFFAGVYSWRKLAGLLERLPSASHYRQEQADDPEYARAVLSLPESAQAWRPPLVEFPPDVAALTNIQDQLGQVLAALSVLITHKPAPRVTPSARPETEIDRVRKRQRHDRHLSLVAEVEQAQRRWAARHN